MNRLGRRTIIVILVGLIFCFLSNQAECGIILKSLVVNPSKTKTQKALLKAYLPKEAMPEDVIDIGDLEIDYDITKALYYVYKEFELKPGESVIRQIEIKDVWIIPQQELDNLNSKARENLQTLEKTEYVDTATSMQRDIEEKAAAILRKQEQALDALPQTHIAVYRENQVQLNSIKNMLAKLEQMVVESKITTGAVPVKRISIKATWWVILGVIISLGLLSLIFFIIWHRQAGVELVKQKREEEQASPEGPSAMPPEEESGTE